MCPDCREPLIVVERDGIEIDYCLDCRGTWLDAGELEQMGTLAGVEPDAVSAALQDARARTRGPRRCPRCDRRMEVATLAVGGIEVDRCPVGHGLWFDAGEIRALVGALAGGEAGALAHFFADTLSHSIQDQPKGG